jgi:hypothetical protein
MAMDLSIFAAEFSEMFNSFVKQQHKFQESIDKTFKKITKHLDDSGKVATKPLTTTIYKNENQRSYLNGRPDVPQEKKPRQVVQSSIKVFVEDISKKASDKLGPVDKTKDVKSKEDKPEGIWGKILGGLLGALGVVGASFMLNKSGFDTSMISSVFGGAGLIAKLVKPLKPLLKRLPLIGLLISLGEAIVKFKDGSPDKILSGLLDLTSGIAYLFPGIGTAVGLGVDLLNYFLTNKMEDLKKTGGKFTGFGDLFKRMLSGFMETPFIKWFVDLGDKVTDVWTNPGIESLYNFFEHIGLVSVSNFIHSLDRGIGSMLGLKDSEGNSQSLTTWFGDWVDKSIIQPIKDFFNHITDMIAGGILAIGVMVGEAFDSVKKLADDLNPKKNIEEISRLEKETRESEATAADKQSTLSYKRKSELLGFGYTAAELSAMSPEESDKAYIGRNGPKSTNKTAEEQPADNENVTDFSVSTKNKPAKNQDFGDYEMQDFSVSNEKINAIVTGDKVQQFSKSDTIIGFKEGEALIKGIESLIAVGQQQLQMLQLMFENNNQQNIIAPTSNNTTNYSFSVASGVDLFRKMV